MVLSNAEYAARNNLNPAVYCFSGHCGCVGVKVLFHWRTGGARDRLGVAVKGWGAVVPQNKACRF